MTIKDIYTKFQNTEEITDDFKKEIATELAGLPQENIAENVQQLCELIVDERNAIAIVEGKESVLKKDKKRHNEIVTIFENAVEKMLNGEEFLSSNIKVSYRKSTVALITDLSKVPAEYFKERTDSDVKKNVLKTDLLSGKNIDGAVLEERSNMNIKSLEPKPEE